MDAGEYFAPKQYPQERQTNPGRETFSWLVPNGNDATRESPTMTMNSRVRAIREAGRAMHLRHAVCASPEAVCGLEAGTVAVTAYVGAMMAIGAGASSSGVLAASVIDAILIGATCGAIGTLFVQWLGMNAATVCRTEPGVAERSRGQAAGRS